MIVETKKFNLMLKKMELWMWYIFYWSFLREDMSICVQTCMFNFQSQAPMDQINFFKWKGHSCHYFQTQTSIYDAAADGFLRKYPDDHLRADLSSDLSCWDHMFSGCYSAVADSISRTRLPLPVSWSFRRLYLSGILQLCLCCIFPRLWVSLHLQTPPKQPHPHPHHLLCLKMYFCPFSLALTPPQSVQLPLPLRPPPP